MNIQDFEEHSKANDKNSPWFHFVREKAGQCAKCKLWKKLIKTHGGSISGLHTHLKTILKVSLLKRDVGCPTILDSSEFLLIISTENDDDNSSFLVHQQTLPLIQKIRKVVKIFRSLPTKNDKVLQKYVKEEFGKELSLVLYSKTRWNSLVSMIERFVKLKNCIKKSLIDLKSPFFFQMQSLKCCQISFQFYFL